MNDDDHDFEELNHFDDYYSILNVSRQASPEEINSAYRQFSRIYHPDKHQDVEKKTQAEVLFNRIKKAYEVLSNPHSRAIYDNLGQKGLETEGWEIVQRQKTPEELREEYEQLRREREERRLQQKTNPRGTIIVHVNATDVFSKYESEYDDSMFPSIEVSGMSMSQSIEAPLTTRDTAVLNGTLNLSNGVGSGAFIVTGRRLINKGWLALEAGAGNGPLIGLKGSRTLTQRIFCNGGLTFSFRPNMVLPGLVGTLAVQLDKHTVGYLTYNAGLQSSLATVVEKNTEKYHWNVTCLLGVPHCFISASYMRRFIEQEMKLRLAAKVGTFGFMTEYGAEKKVSKYSSLHATVLIGVPSGVTLKVKYTRSSQSYIFPIHLSEEIIPAAVFYATVTPLIAWFVLKKAIIDPMNAEHKKRKIDKAKEQNKTRLAERRKEAESAVSLMSATYDRIVIDEEKKRGLIIIRAVYGRAEDIAALSEEAISENLEIVDVKVALQCLVKDSRLVLQKSSKCDLPGFYDTCMGEDKSLKIDYKYRDNSYSITIDDKDDLRLPKFGLSPT